MAIIQRHLTLEEFLALPERKPALEHEDGVVTQKIMPKGKHSRLRYAITERINRFAAPARLAWAFPELRTTYAGTSRVPDVAVYRWSRIPLDASGEVANDFEEPPDIAVEIVSPKQSVTLLVRRCLWYVEHGVSAAMLVDPTDKSVLLFRPGRTVQALHGTDPIALEDILPEFRLTVQELFASLTMA